MDYGFVMFVIHTIFVRLAKTDVTNHVLIKIVNIDQQL